MSEPQISTITGKVAYILFRNEENLYTVLKLSVRDERERSLTAVGYIGEIEAGQVYTFQGTYVEHPRYGLQFSVTSLQKKMPDDSEGIIRYLSGPSFPGIGRKTAQRIVAVLGEDCLERIKEDSSFLMDHTELDSVSGLSTEKRRMIVSVLKESDDGMAELARLLSVHGVGMHNLHRLNRVYGKDALKKIKENPYRVIEECEGFGFKTADEIGHSLGVPADDERRLYAMLIALANNETFRTGDSWVDVTRLEELFLEQCHGLSFDFEELLRQTEINRSLIREENRIYPVRQMESERYIATFLNEFPYQTDEEVPQADVSNAIRSLEKELGIEYDGDQIQAIEALFQASFMIMTGGPGTGKTTVVKAMTELYRRFHPAATIICAAPTGRAAKHLSDITGVKAYTIHSMLKWDLESNEFGKNEDDPLLADLLIVDEFSMVDQYLFARLLMASGHIRRICLIGDEDQLPSVSPGSVLRDLIASEQFPVEKLTHIYRQQSGSDVINLAHDIHFGQVDFKRYQNDVAFFDQDPSQIKSQIASVIRSAYEKGYRIDDIQVLSPIYAGAAGIDILNRYLQSVFNPAASDKREIRFEYTVFREGDKILQLRNQPDDDVYNGDIGILREILFAGETEEKKDLMIVDFDGIFVTYTRDTFSNMTLAYCISIHKSQGSEYPLVVMPIIRQHAFVLQRNLLYTGVTRAKRALVLLGDRDVFLKGIEVIDRHRRNTTLKERVLNYDPFGME